MNWGMEDLIAAAALLIAVAIAVTVVFRATHSRVWRLILTGVVVLIAFAVWAQLAVGIV
jgi:hypothetical protein